MLAGGGVSLVERLPLTGVPSSAGVPTKLEVSESLLKSTPPGIARRRWEASSAASVRLIADSFLVAEKMVLEARFLKENLAFGASVALTSASLALRDLTASPYVR